MFRKISLSVLLFSIIMPAFSQTVIKRNGGINCLIAGVSRDSLRSYIQTLVSFGTRHTLSSQTDPEHGIGAARNWVLSKFQQDALRSDGRMTAKMDTWIQPEDDRERVNRSVLMGNLMATIKGTDPADDRIFIVSGHLDSRCTNMMDSTDAAPGANDDGSGVAAVMEIARLLSKFPLKSTVVLVAVTGEEQGLLGSTHLPEEAKENHWNISAMINNDMIGNSVSSGTDKHDNTQVRVFSEGIPYVETQQEERLRKALAGENDSRSRELTRYIKTIAPSAPENAAIDISHLSNDTHLYWQPPKYGKAKGYDVLMRETDAPMWQKKFYTDSTEITLPYSRDNFFFAIQSVGENGLLSVPVFPGIGR